MHLILLIRLFATFDYYGLISRDLFLNSLKTFNIVTLTLWPINSGVLTSLLFPQVSSSLTANFQSSSTFNNPFVTVPKAPITVGNIVTFMFHSFFNSLTRSRYLFLFSHSFSFIMWSVDNFAVFLFFIC